MQIILNNSFYYILKMVQGRTSMATSQFENETLFLCKVRQQLISSAGILIGICLAAPAPLVHAQEVSLLEEVVVTARKREESFVDVPISITTFSSKAIENSGATRLQELKFSVPNMAMREGNASTSTIGFRGIVSAVRNIGFDSAVGVYVDDVFIGRPVAFNADFFDVAQVEVLRGPQGTLFGRNTMVGAINVRTLQPSDEFTGRIKLTAGNNNTLNANGYVSGALVEGAAWGSLSVATFNRDGFVNNIFDGKKYGDENRDSVRGKFVFAASDTLEISINADYLDEDSLRHPSQILENGALSTSAQDLASLSVIDHNFPNTEKRQISGVSTIVSWDFPNEMNLQSITAARYSDFEITVDDDRSSGGLSIHSTFLDESDQFTQEFRITSPGDNRFRYVAGLYYLDVDSSTDRSTPLNGNPGLSIDARVQSESFAAFGSADYDLTEQLTATVGLRWTTEDKEVIFSQTPGLGFPAVAEIKDARTDSAVSGNVAVNYAVSDSVAAYGTVAKGFKSGGFNTDYVGNDQIEFDEESVISYELGIKATLGDGRGRLNGSVFFMDYSDLQVNTQTAVGFQLGNAGGAETKGFEVDFLYYLSDQLLFQAAVGYTDSEYTDFDPCTSGGASCNGNPLVFAPEWTANAALEYTYPLNSGASLAFRGEWTYRDEYFSQATADSNSIVGLVDEASLGNARLTFEPAEGRFKIALWVKNIMDETHFMRNQRFAPLGGTHVGQVAIPRTYGIDLTFEL